MMYAVRQLAFVGFCTLMPIALVTEASAMPLPPPPTVRVTMSRQTLTITPWTGRSCTYTFNDYSTTSAADPGPMAAFLYHECGDTRVLSLLRADTRWSDGGSAHARVVGSAELWRYEGGRWVQKIRPVEWGKNWFNLPISDFRMTSTIGSGTGSASFTYRITARRL